MKVKITHTVDLDSVAERTKKLLQPAFDDVKRSLASLEALYNLLSGDEEELNLAVQHLDLSRRKLAQADTVLSECHGMLSGVNDYYLEQTEKRIMEEQLRKQEEELARQEAQQSAKTVSPPPVHDFVSPPGSKVWDPKTKSSSPIQDGGE
jgi:hypothetical protein